MCWCQEDSPQPLPWVPILRFWHKNPQKTDFIPMPTSHPACSFSCPVWEEFLLHRWGMEPWRAGCAALRWAASFLLPCSAPAQPSALTSFRCFTGPWTFILRKIKVAAPCLARAHPGCLWQSQQLSPDLQNLRPGLTTKPFFLSQRWSSSHRKNILTGSEKKKRRKNPIKILKPEQICNNCYSGSMQGLMKAILCNLNLKQAQYYF